MRNAFIYGGAFFGADRTTNMLGSLSEFNILAKVLILFFIICMAILGGVGGALLNDSIKFIKGLWNGTGKKKALKQYLM